MCRIHSLARVLAVLLTPAWAVCWPSEAADNARLEPGCWKKELQAAVAEADRLTVEPSPGVKLSKGKDGTKPTRPIYFEINGKENVATLISLIEIDEARSGSHCKCYGRKAFHFYRGDELLVRLGYAHFHSLKWINGNWEGDALLTTECQVALPMWFKEKGFPDLYETREAELAEKRKEIAENELFASFFPEGGVGGDPVTVAVAVYKALGASSMPMHATGNKERRALAAVARISGTDFLAALEQLKDNPRDLVGAARIFFRTGSERWLPEHDVRDSMSQETRLTWTLRISEAVLTHGHHRDKPWVLWHLTGFNEPSVRSLLHRVAEGKVGEERNPAETFRQEPSLQAGALLSLAILGDDTIKHEVEQRLAVVEWKQEVAALEVCLALFGDPSYLKKEHFTLHAYSIGLAALNAIERFDGLYGMDLLVEGGFSHPWGYVRDEAGVTFDRITGTNFASVSRDPYPLRLAREWWDANGETFLRERRSAGSAPSSDEP